MINFAVELNNLQNDLTQMAADKRRIFLTGATGVMGSHALSELVSSAEPYEIIVLARDSVKNRRKLRPFEGKGVRVIWGDLLDREAVASGVAVADVVLHVGGMVSPEADWHPAETLRVNVGAMRNILDAALPRKDEVRLVYVGSVSQYGPHCPPDIGANVAIRSYRRIWMHMPTQKLKPNACFLNQICVGGYRCACLPFFIAGF